MSGTIITSTSTVVSEVLNTLTLTQFVDVTVTDIETQDGSTITITSVLPAITSTIVNEVTVTTTVLSTSILPTPSPTSRPIAPSISCSSDCQIDVTATRLGYPGQVFVATTTVPVFTLDIYTNAAGEDVSSFLRSVPVETATPTTLTWEFSGVPLTWPTVYAAYATFSHISVEPIGTDCVSETLTLALPSPTNYEPLILPESEIPNTQFVAPVVVDYLNSLPTVLAQLGQPIGAGACDPIIGSTADPRTSTLGSTTIKLSVAALGSTDISRIPQAVVAPTSTAAPPPAPVLSAEPVLETPLPPPPPAPPSAVPEPSESPPPPVQLTPSVLSSATSPLSSSAIQLPAVSETSAGLEISTSLILPSRSATGPTIPDGTTSAVVPSSSTSEYTGAAAYPTAKGIGFLFGAAGVGLGLL